MIRNFCFYGDYLEYLTTTHIPYIKYHKQNATNTSTFII